MLTVPTNTLVQRRRHVEFTVLVTAEKVFWSASPLVSQRLQKCRAGQSSRFSTAALWRKAGALLPVPPCLAPGAASISWVPKNGSSTTTSFCTAKYSWKYFSCMLISTWESQKYLKERSSNNLYCYRLLKPDPLSFLHNAGEESQVIFYEL